MAFISNKQRNKNAKYIGKGILIKKWILFSVIAAGIAFSILTVLMLAQDFGLIHWAWLNLGITSDPNSDNPLPIDPTGKMTISAFAYVYLILAVFEVVFGIIALIIVLTLKSPKQVAARTAFLAKSAIPGKKKSKSTTKQRISKSKK